MAKLVLSRGGTLLREIPLVTGTITIGRHDDNDIALDDQSASGHHAQVVLTDSQYVAEDLRSTNGTLINAQKIERKVLENNDVIVIGKHEIRFVGEVAPVGNPSDFEKTVVLGALPKKAVTSPPPAPAAQSRPPSITLDLDPPAPTPAKKEEGVFVKVLVAAIVMVSAIVAVYLYWKTMR